MSEIRPFKIEVPEADLELLKKKLSLKRLPEAIEGEGWEYGAPLADVKRLSEFWEKGYDWRKHEAKLNELSHFKTLIPIDGYQEVDMHFVHQKSNVKGAIPLLFVHGWPGSFIEATKIIPLLAKTDDGSPAFHVVVPSLPNFGLSSQVTKKQFGLPQYAEACHKVMIKLGYNEYVTQGGDWGNLITRALGHLYPKHVKAIHTNWANVPMPSFFRNPILFTTSMLKFVGIIPYLGSLISYIPGATYTKQELKDLERAQAHFMGKGRGYYTILSTKPQTVSVSLTDSPVGLLSFLWEKLHDWTDAYDWTDDEILTWISIYWFSAASPGSSGVIYKEAIKSMEPGGSLPYTKLMSWLDMPLGVSYFPGEVANMPRSWLSQAGKWVFISDHDKGGHFAAFERPDAIAKDLQLMFGKGGGAFGVVPGLDGY